MFVHLAKGEGPKPKTKHYVTDIGIGLQAPRGKLQEQTPKTTNQRKIVMKSTFVKSLLVSSSTILLVLTAVLPARADYSNTVMSLHPIAYWRLNEPAFPVLVYPTGTATNIGSVGAAANGTYIHSPVLQQPGALAGDPDRCALFNTVDQNLQIPYNATLNPTGSFTVEFWADYTNDPPSGTAAPIENVGSSGRYHPIQWLPFLCGEW